VEKESGPWFAILTFCATMAVVAALGLSILVASATLAFALANRLTLPHPGAPQPAAAAQVSPAAPPTAADLDKAGRLKAAIPTARSRRAHRSRQ